MKFPTLHIKKSSGFKNVNQTLPGRPIEFGMFILLALFLLSACKKDRTTEELFNQAESRDGRWCWVPVPGMSCRNGSETGIGVRFNPDSKKLLIYIEGGGACINATTCSGTPSFFGKTQFGLIKGSLLQSGIYNKKNEKNPFMNTSATSTLMSILDLRQTQKTLLSELCMVMGLTIVTL